MNENKHTFIRIPGPIGLKIFILGKMGLYQTAYTKLRAYGEIATANEIILYKKGISKTDNKFIFRINHNYRDII